MNELSLAAAQADMRQGHRHGAPGVLASGLVWLTAAAVAQWAQAASAVWALLLGGVFIHPLGIMLGKALGHPGRHRVGNPLAGLAMEGTLWMLAGIAIAVGLQALRLEWFFPAMLLTIGGRYLTFQTIYGLRIYWVLGAVLCAAGLALGLARAPVAQGALAGAAIEIVFAAAIFWRARRDAAAQGLKPPLRPQ